MIGQIYIDNTKIGEADFKVIDETMGGIGGELLPDVAYEVYRNKIQKLYAKKGIANINDFNFKIIIGDDLIHSEGGIGITNSAEFEEIYVDAAGISSDIIQTIKSKE